MKPKFICIGAQKAGTSWLYARLSEHPEFNMIPVKEIHYFDRSPCYPSPNTLAETRLLNRSSPGYLKSSICRILRSIRSKDLRLVRWWINYYFQNYSDAWYLKLFDFEFSGDITPSYSILSRKDVERMHSVTPGSKLIFLMRNPVERAWSHYRFSFGNSMDLDNLNAFKSFVDSPLQELRSDYLRTIDLYLSYFDSSQLLLGFYDAIIDQPEALLSAILKHIGATDTIAHGSLRQINNKSKEADIPGEYRNYLENKYRDDIEKLARRYGGYASRWLSCNKGKYTEQADGANRLSPVAHP